MAVDVVCPFSGAQVFPPQTCNNIAYSKPVWHISKLSVFVQTWRIDSPDIDLVWFDLIWFIHFLWMTSWYVRRWITNFYQKISLLQFFHSKNILTKGTIYLLPPPLQEYEMGDVLPRGTCDLPAFPVCGDVMDLGKWGEGGKRLALGGWWGPTKKGWAEDAWVGGKGVEI